ncbi:LON peptidase substrate-binding domain-containing protein [Catellatospora paridis]|uniref:LON peptidase substrate-binding domain-containing protein n=1 Tax=Catellatospora paridis TaxID=1617086 RepID=UPI0012D3CC33|nr:LON peptidase substrate-binding domain-containing protein [Catellatospora paridis]
MTGTLPLFPLGTVLFPGLVLPLHIFEERWRTLMRNLMELPDGTPREFGVVAIERGLEVMPPPHDGVATSEVVVHEVGCVAQLRKITERPDGKFDIVTVGARRFRITGFVPSPHPYPVVGVEWLPDPAPDELADQLAPRVLAAFREYLSVLRGGPDDQLPDDPTVLSNLVAASASLTVGDRQQLLSAPDPATRLRHELTMLARETALLREVRAVPAQLSQLGPAPVMN